MFGILSDKLFGGGYIKRFPIQSDSLVYAIGDIHGCYDQLVPLLENVLNDAMEHEDPALLPAEVVFLGDVIDRGPSSRAVMEFLLAIKDWPEITPVFLMGNHEEMLLNFLDDPVEHKRWLRFGGYETLRSYDLTGLGDLLDERNLVRVAGELKTAMGPHLDLLDDFVTWHRNGNLLFTHAGADPDVDPGDQPVEMLVWGSETFQKKMRKDGLWVVHGHNIVTEPLVGEGWISIDTGAYMSGSLTALRVDGEQVSFLSETGEDKA